MEVKICDKYTLILDKYDVCNGNVKVTVKWNNTTVVIPFTERTVIRRDGSAFTLLLPCDTMVDSDDILEYLNAVVRDKVIDNIAYIFNDPTSECYVYNIGSKRVLCKHSKSRTVTFGITIFAKIDLPLFLSKHSYKPSYKIDQNTYDNEQEALSVFYRNLHMLHKYYT